MPTQYPFISEPYSWEDHVPTKDRCAIVLWAESLMRTQHWTQKETLDFLTDAVILKHPNENRSTNAKATLLGENLEWSINERKAYQYKLTTLIVQIVRGMTLERMRNALVDVLHAKEITRKTAPPTRNKPSPTNNQGDVDSLSSEVTATVGVPPPHQAQSTQRSTTTPGMIENAQSDWFGNGGDTIGSILKMTPTQLASWNSTVTNENEIAQREYLSHFKSSLVDIPADTLRNFNDSHYLMELKKQAVIEVEQGSYFFSTKMNFDTDDHKNILIVLPLCEFHSQTQKEKSRVPTTAPTSVNENVSVLEDPTTEAIQKQKKTSKLQRAWRQARQRILNHLIKQWRLKRILYRMNPGILLPLRQRLSSLWLMNSWMTKIVRLMNHIHHYQKEWKTQMAKPIPTLHCHFCWRQHPFY